MTARTASTARAGARLAAIASLAIATGPASAQPGSVAAPKGTAADRAEALYREGSALMQRGELDAACPKLAESQQLEPAPGAALAVALCRERQGKLATAVAAYAVAARLARTSGDEERALAAEARAEALRPRVPKIEIAFSPALRARAPLEIVVDGDVATTTTDVARAFVDAGSHWVEARAGGRASGRTTFEAREGALTLVTLDDVARSSAPPPDATPPRATPAPHEQPGWSATRVIGVTAVGLGVVGLGVGTVFAVAGASDAETLDELGYDGDRGTCRSDLERCQNAFDGADGAADASTALWIAGGALVALGVTLFATSGSGGDGSDQVTALQLTPAGARIVGGF